MTGKKYQYSMQILASSLISSLGNNKQAHLNAFINNQTGLSATAPFLSQLPSLQTFVGEVEDIEATTLPNELAHYHCRNNQLAWAACQEQDFSESLQKAITQFGGDRIGVVMGTSTSGIAETEQFLKQKSNPDPSPSTYHYETTHQMNSLAYFICQAYQLTGPSFVVSTACSSSAKVLAVAQRWLTSDLVDVVLVGGVDSLCLTTLHGFNALGLVSEPICQPLDQNRQGINIGEAAGMMLLTKYDNQALKTAPSIRIVGVGESSDAYHISSPHPEGQGAGIAINKALAQANLSIHDIQYFNLHGTATPSNDLAEIKGLTNLLTEPTTISKKEQWASSTKGFTGHTLGAAGITETIFCQWALEENLVPANLNLMELQAELAEKCQLAQLKVPHETQQFSAQTPLIYAMSNSFGFGGNNASVILKKEPKHEV